MSFDPAGSEANEEAQAMLAGKRVLERKASGERSIHLFLIDILKFLDSR